VTLVDTSVWISALRSARSREATRLSALLDADEVALAAPVRVEILSGASGKDRSRLRRLLSALPYWVPTDATWERVDSWIEPVARAGERFGVVDLLIAALATEHGASLWSLDRDFERMARLHLVTLHPAD
jgi:predicted nucleic acid-binding protein